MADPSNGTGNTNKSLGHLIVQESKEVLKRQNKPKADAHGNGGMAKDTVAN